MSPNHKQWEYSISSHILLLYVLLTLITVSIYGPMPSESLLTNCSKHIWELSNILSVILDQFVVCISASSSNMLTLHSPEMSERDCPTTNTSGSCLYIYLSHSFSYTCTYQVPISLQLFTAKVITVNGVNHRSSTLAAVILSQLCTFDGLVWS